MIKLNILLTALALMSAAPQTSGLAEPGAPVSAMDEPSAASGPSLDPSFKLGPGDRIRITTYGERDLSGEFVVGSDGRLSFPLIGDIQADGQTVRDLQAVIAAKLNGRYVKSPRVSAEVLSYRPYYILGEVNKPGKYVFTTNLTVYNAVATAEGFTYRANKHIVFVKHPAEDKEEKIRLDANTRVQPGDTIRIAERFF